MILAHLDSFGKGPLNCCVCVSENKTDVVGRNCTGEWGVRHGVSTWGGRVCNGRICVKGAFWAEWRAWWRPDSLTHRGQHWVGTTFDVYCVCVRCRCFWTTTTTCRWKLWPIWQASATTAAAWLMIKTVVCCYLCSQSSTLHRLSTTTLTRR